MIHDGHLHKNIENAELVVKSDEDHLRLLHHDELSKRTPGI